MRRPLASGDPGLLLKAQAAGEALTALARAARSLLLYDAANATVRHHLAAYRARTIEALEAHGDLAISVAPFHFAVAGHVAFEDQDREKSLPFRLYQDGVRVVRILADAPWEELLTFLQILAIRYAAVRQQEEDTVTLLRRAEFAFVEIEAVEGFMEVDELSEPKAGVGVARAASAQLPEGWDTPLQKLPAPGPLEYRPISDETLAALRRREDGQDVTELSITLARDLLAEATRGEWPVPSRDLVAFFLEVRDALLVDDQIDSLRRLVEMLARSGGTAARDQILRSMADARMLEIVLARVPADSDELPSGLGPFLPLLGVVPALDALAAADRAARRRLLTRIVLARVPREVEAVIARLRALPPAIVRDLVAGIVARVPERSSEIARNLFTHPDEALRLEGLEAVEKAPGPIPVRLVCALLADPSDAVRARAAEVLGQRGDASVVGALEAVLDSRQAVPPALAAAVGRALATLAPAPATALFGSWIAAKKRPFRGFSPQQRTKQLAAIAGLGLLPGAESERMLRSLLDRADADVRRQCVSTLTRRWNEGGDRG